jgi:hypothetical protein
MKGCGYCGRENADDAVYCRECGTGFTPLAVSDHAARPGPGSWVWQGRGLVVLAVLGAILLAGCLYMLSLGPVERYVATITTTTPNLSTTGYTLVPMGTSYTKVAFMRTIGKVRTVRLPGCVAAAYRPAWALRGRVGIYESYLSWWEDQTAR